MSDGATGRAVDDRDIWLEMRTYFRHEARQIKMENGPVAVARYRNMRRIVGLIEQRFNLKPDEETRPPDRGADKP